MKLLSCHNCGVVLNADLLNFSEDIYQDDGVVDTSLARWDGENWSPFIYCPCCDEGIFEDGTSI